MTSNNFKNKAKVNFIVKFLWFCSGANIRVLEKCPTDYNQFATVGFTVLLTAGLAYLSGGYAIFTIFKNIGAAIGFGGFWALMIGNLDRFLVSIRKSSSKSSGVNFSQWFIIGMRLGGAIAIGFVLAKPLEVRIFEDPIKKEIIENNNKERENFKQTLNDQAIVNLKNEIATASIPLQAIESEIRKAEQGMLKERTGRRAGRGTRWSGYNDSFIYQQTKLTQKKDELKIVEKEAKLKNLENERKAKLDEYEKKLVDSQQSPDIITSLEALEKLGKDDKGNFTIYAYSSWLITLIFVFIDVAPVFAKIFTKSPVYDALLTLEESNQEKLISAKLNQEHTNNLNNVKTNANEKNEIKKRYRAIKNKKRANEVLIDEIEVEKETQAINKISKHPDHIKSVEELTNHFVKNGFTRPSSQKKNRVLTSFEKLGKFFTPISKKLTNSSLKRLLPYGIPILGGTALLSIFPLLWLSKINIRPLPLPTDNSFRQLVIYDKNKKIVPDSQAHHELEKLEDFSKYLQYALLVSEDRRFYQHFGIDHRVIKAVAGGEGGSTITQQLTRTVFKEVGQERNIMRKIREILVTLKVEATYGKDSKNEILKAYLNRAFLGINHFGFEDAAQSYFHKSAKNLNLAESATLVVLLPAPNKYNVVFKPKNYDQDPRDYKDYLEKYDKLIKKRNLLIKNMFEQQGKLKLPESLNTIKITSQDVEESKKQPIKQKFETKQSNSTIPFFYDYLLNKDIEQVLGKDKAQKNNFIIETSLDSFAQKQAEEIIQENINKRGYSSHYSQGALVTLDSKNGEILALVGGKDNLKNVIDPTTTRRTPASTFKLFTYTAGIEKGLSPNDLFSCDSLIWKSKFQSCVRSNGSITMAKGLARSENPVALRIAQKIGLEPIVAVAQKMGINTELDSNDPVVALGLGEKTKATVLEMTGAYSAISNKGLFNSPRAIRRILDRDSCQKYDQPDTCKVIYPPQNEENSSNLDNHYEKQVKVIEPEVANTMREMLRGVVTETRATGNAARDIPGAIGKTGTSDDSKDLWFIGAIPESNIVTGIWLGNINNAPTKSNSGEVAGLWSTYMKSFASQMNKK